MGKYTKKAKMTAGAALTTDASQSYLGVRTHAKTLALQRLPSASSAALPPSKPDACYLELRSRRLEKPMQPQNSPFKRSCGEADAEIGSRDETEGERRGIETTFDENHVDFDDRERGTGESSPYTITTRGSPMNRAYSSAATQRLQNDALLVNAHAPSARELEEFFAREEQSMQRQFIEKYNFDVVGDLPLPGRYEWVAVMP